MPATESPQSHLSDALGPRQAPLGMDMVWGVAEGRAAVRTATSTRACIQGPSYCL